MRLELWLVEDEKEYKDETKTVILYEQKILFVVILAVFGFGPEQSELS